MNPGLLDRRVIIRRRAYVDKRTRGAFGDLVACWARYQRSSGRETLAAGRETDIEEGVLTVRALGPAAELTQSDRVVIGGREFAVRSIGTPDRRTGFREILVTTDVASTSQP